LHICDGRAWWPRAARALHLEARDAEVRRDGVELDAERAHIVSSGGIETIQGNAFDAIAHSESFWLFNMFGVSSK
jgi:hypothetical protein